MISHADYPSEKDTVPMLISFVVPCYNEEESLPLFYDEACRVANVLRQQSHAEAEFIFVDDGSGDKTLEKLRALHAKDERVHYISFSRNFGKEAGLYAGLKSRERRLCSHLRRRSSRPSISDTRDASIPS